MSALADQVLAEPTARDLPPAELLDRDLRDASPAQVIAAALKTVGREHLALVSSFGTESAALLKVMADVDASVPVIFLDTGWLFEETLAYRDTLIAKLGLRDVRSIKPLEETLSREDPDRELWFSDPDACCRWRPIEIQSVRQCLARSDRGDLCRGKAAAASAGGVGLSVGRVHALQQPDLAGRGCARRSLARQGQDRMRHPHGQVFIGPSLHRTMTLRRRKQ